MHQAKTFLSSQNISGEEGKDSPQKGFLPSVPLNPLQSRSGYHLLLRNYSRAGGCGYVLENLPSTSKALSWISSTAKRKRNVQHKMHFAGNEKNE